jgi:hypothetical protein
VLSHNSRSGRSPVKAGSAVLPRVKGRQLVAGRGGRSITRGGSVSSRRGKK